MLFNFVRLMIFAFFDAMMAKYTLKPRTERTCHHASTLSKVEIMLLMMLFHDSDYRCLKHFYQERYASTCTISYPGSSGSPSEIMQATFSPSVRLNVPFTLLYYSPALAVALINLSLKRVRHVLLQPFCLCFLVRCLIARFSYRYEFAGRCKPVHFPLVRHQSLTVPLRHGLYGHVV